MEKKSVNQSNTQTVALAGEFFVLAQLALQGYIGTLTLGNTKSVDILVSNPKTEKLFRVEVKTASRGPYNSKLFGQNLEWIMDEKHESISHENLFYCFVFLQSPKEMPRFFIVPSVAVAKYVCEQHKDYMNSPRKQSIKNTPMRMFRIATLKDARGLSAKDFEDRWGSLS